MIPSSISPQCLSPGEKEIFARLKDEHGTEEWIVLHSLDIALHLRQVAGEADFVIIVPSLGVLCLEVKACNSLQRRDGLWYYGRAAQGDPRGPFKQSSEAMHSIRQQVIRSDSRLSCVPFCSAVVFPYVDFSIISNEWHPWQVISATTFRRQPLATLLRGILHSARLHLGSQSTCAWFREADRLPNRQQAATIARILRPSFEFLERSDNRRLRQQAEILRYTEEQFVALDTMAENERVLFTGPAGTGKTVLAIEVVRRAINSGKKVLFLCYNRLLGRWLAKHPALQDNAVTVRTLHQYLLSVARITPPSGAGDLFWNTQLPDKAVTRLLEGHSDLEGFEVIVTDEVQDFCKPVFFDVLEMVLNGGLTAGNWRMFGDFERQMLYGQDREGAEELLRTRLGSFTKCSLRVNCRNTPRIATLSYLLGKLTPSYTRILRPDDRIDPLISYFATPSQQRKELARILERLEKESYSNDDIVILSPKAGSKCASASLTVKPWCDRLAPIEANIMGCIPFTTIQSYKGLESPVIIVTDIEHLDSDIFSSLFYVATTRALERLCILVHETAKQDIITALVGNSSNRMKLEDRNV